MDIQPIGNHWFLLYPDGSSLEYNKGANPLADYQADRNPQASVFRHIDGNKVLAVIYDDGRKEKPFFYKDSDREQAFRLAKDYVEAYFKDKEIQHDIFSQPLTGH
jgi:hypothetical protein